MKEEAYPEDERNRLVREIFEGSRAAKVTFVKPENEWAYATTQAWHAVITTGRETFPHDIPGYLMALLANQPARKGETRTFGSRG